MSHCSLFHRYHLHNLFPHHSATDQECNFHQDGTEIHSRYNQQENESLKLKWGRKRQRGKDRREIIILLDDNFFMFFFFSGISMLPERIYFHFSCLIAIIPSDICKFILEMLMIEEKMFLPSHRIPESATYIRKKEDM